MGFRSTFVSESWSLTWPEWFVEKYQKLIHFPPDNCGVIASRYGAKMYAVKEWGGLADDIRKVLLGQKMIDSLCLVFLHECRGVSRVEITRTGIVWSEPDRWYAMEKCSHYNCWPCSPSRGKFDATQP